MADEWMDPCLSETSVNNSSCHGNICNAYNTTEAMHLTGEAVDVLTYMYILLTVIMSILSVIGSSLIIFYYCQIPTLRNKSRQLLVYLSVCDLFIALGNIMGVAWIKLFRSEHPDNYKTSYSEQSVWDWNTVDHLWICKLQAVICTGFSIASFLWTSFIALNVFLTVVCNNKTLSMKYQWLLHIVSWGVTVTVVTVVLVNNRFGYNPCLDLTWWCWIQPLPKDTSTTSVIGWQLFGGKIWEMVSYVLVLILYTAVKLRLKKHVATMESNMRPFDSTTVIPHTVSESTAYINANRKLTYIPLVFIIARIWGTVRFLLGVSDPYAALLGSYIAPLQALGDSAQGFFNCLVFILTTPILKERFKLKKNQLCKSGCAKSKPPIVVSHSRVEREDNSSSSEDDEYPVHHASINISKSGN